MSKRYKINIVLPDYSYLPQDINVMTCYYGENYLEAAKAHLDRQCQILKDWMTNDPSCTIPVSFKDMKKASYPVIYQKSFTANPGNVNCIFEIIETEI